MEKDKIIHFFILNMAKNTDRYHHIEQMMKSIGCSYSRIEAIDGTKMKDSMECKKILKIRPNLLNSTLTSLGFKQEWKYDGSILNSFPGLNLLGHEGAKGLILSNMKAFEEALMLDYEWYCILEDDAVIDLSIYHQLCEIVNKDANKNVDVLLLDDRSDGFGGTAGMMYRINIIGRLLEDLHPLSEFSINMESNHGLATLWDWKLWKYIQTAENPIINYLQVPCIKSGNFDSTIN
uniref:Glycosyl transferase family 25 domain-containing protein n=1 Tax=viral metagenome TaxID=1070528 RepID=A0A6C0E218_9ZZZZ